MAMTNDEVTERLEQFLPAILDTIERPQEANEDDEAKPAAPIELVAVIVKGNPPQRKVSVVLHEQGGLSIDTISLATKAISQALDEQERQGEDMVHGKYTLEVTSPGLSWPLTTAKDFARVVGRQVKIVTPTDQLTGELTGVHHHGITIRTKLKGQSQSETCDIAYGDIVSGVQALPW